ncbi:MAG: phenylalanine--tRNA ligase subunit beta, partial [Bacteroidota bacterium]
PEHDGIMVLDEAAVVGAPALGYLEIDQDFVLEIDLTPNRIDGASHYGVARDLAAYMRDKDKAHLPEIKTTEEGGAFDNPIPVTVKDTDKCKRYTSIYIKGVEVKESPDWLKKRLTTIGLRPINNIVDITNFVLHELGQPMHAFDADKLEGKEIIVKTLEEKTKFITLDGDERELLPHADLLICDAKNPRCIAGTMGGLNSGVTFDTKNVFLEVAYFDPGTVRKQAKRLGINSDSSFRYERGADPFMTEIAARRASDLILEIAGGEASKMADQIHADFPAFEVDLSVQTTQSRIGKEISRTEIIEILTSLSIEVEEDKNEDVLHLKVPVYRVDVLREIDVIEEVLRVYGYNNIDIPPKLNASLTFSQYRDDFRLKENYADHLAANGFYEIMTNSLVSVKHGDEKAVPILNPLSEDLGIMRQSMLPGALESIQYNQNRQQENLAFFEFGKTYKKAGEDYQEREWLALSISGSQHGNHWSHTAKKQDLFSLTREVERLQSWFSFKGKLREIEHPDFDYGMELIYDRQSILSYGKVKEDISEAYDLRNEVFYLLIDWSKLKEVYYSNVTTFEPIPQFPSIRRDISMLLAQDVQFSELDTLIRKANPKLIRSVELHDVYMGDKIAKGKKSYLISIELRDDKKTLEDSTADKVMNHLYKQLERQMEVEIRR